MSKGESGISLIEVLAILALAAVLVAIAVPSVSSSLNSYRLASAADLIAAELQMARVLSVSRNTAYQINIDTGAGTIQVVDPDDPQNPPRTAKLLGSGVSFQQVPGEPISFYSRGHARGGQIMLRDEQGNTVRIEVGGSGRVHIKETAVDETG